MFRRELSTLLLLLIVSITPRATASEIPHFKHVKNIGVRGEWQRPV
jgi:hypothetical protein